MPVLARAAMAIRPFFTRVNKTEGKIAAILKMEERSIQTLLDKGKVDAKLVLRQVRLFLAKRGELTLYRPEDVDAFLQSKMKESVQIQTSEYQLRKHRTRLAPADLCDKGSFQNVWSWRPMNPEDRIWGKYVAHRNGQFVSASMFSAEPGYRIPQRLSETILDMKSELQAPLDITTHVSDYVSYGEAVDPFLAIVPRIATTTFEALKEKMQPRDIPMLIVAHWDEPDFKAVPDRW